MLGLLSLSLCITYHTWSRCRILRCSQKQKTDSKYAYIVVLVQPGEHLSVQPLRHLAHVAVLPHHLVWRVNDQKQKTDSEYAYLVVLVHPGEHLAPKVRLPFCPGTTWRTPGA